MRLTAKAPSLSSRLSPSIRHAVAANRKAGNDTVQDDFGQSEDIKNALPKASSKVPKKDPVGSVNSLKGGSASPMAIGGHLRSDGKSPAKERSRPMAAKGSKAPSDKSKKLVGVY